MEEKNTNEPSFITCPDCNGCGRSERKVLCRKCGGIGMGSFFEGKFLYWGALINRSSINLRRLKQILNSAVDFLAILIFFSGVISIIYWAWQDNSNNAINILLFWQIKSFYILYFYIACLSLMFLVYRDNKKKIDEKRIKEIKFKQTNNFPDNWEELKKFNHQLDVSIGFKEKTLIVLEDAFSLALKLGENEIKPIHLFSSMLKSTKIAVLFTRLNVSGRELVERLNHQFEKTIPKISAREADLKISLEVKKILIQGFEEAYLLHQDNANVLNLIIPCVKSDPIIKEILLDLKVTEDKIKNSIEWFRISEKQIANYRLYKKLASFKPQTAMDRAYTAVATPLLNNFGYDLTLAAKWGRLGLCVGREEELNAIFDAFKSGSYGVILTGSDGVGKKTIIEGLATEMVTEEKIPEFLKDKRLIELDIARLVSGANPNEAQERLLSIINEIHRAKNIILYIENLENIVGSSSGQQQSVELSEILGGELERGSLLCLASATDSNYTKYIEHNAVAKSFSRLKIKEPEGDRAIQILESKIGYLEAGHNVFFSYNAIEAALELSAKFIHNKSLPEKAIEILEKTAVYLANKHKNGKYICTKNDIAITVNQITDIPTQELEDSEEEKLLNLEAEIHKYMIGQEEAVRMVADSLRRARTDLHSGKRPLANFLFLGPTGVGKTELAKTIMRVYFERKDFLIRLDMSEYESEDSIKKMIGDANGYTGYLTEAVRQKPFSLILLDEFEKANSKILNLFLQVMDDGRLTDGQGQTIDFTNSIIIATSNAGSEFIQNEIIKGTPIEKIKDTLINEYLNKTMPPELINRFDGVIVFKPLTLEDTKKIASLMFIDIKEMLGEKGMGLEISDDGLEVLAKKGFDPKFGARPLRRLIQDKIENEIAKKILGKELNRRDIVVINELGEVEIKKGQEI